MTRDWLTDALMCLAMFLFGTGFGMAVESMRRPSSPNDAVRFGVQFHVRSEPAAQEKT